MQKKSLKFNASKNIPGLVKKYLPMMISLVLNKGNHKYKLFLRLKKANQQKQMFHMKRLAQLR